MKRLLTTGKAIRSLGSSVAAAAVALVLFACGAATDPTEHTIPPGTPQTTAVQSEPITTTTMGVSVLDVDPGYEELGGWWLVPEVNLVVRARVSGIVDSYELGDAGKEIWALEVTKVLLGNTGGSSTLRVARYPSEEVAAGVYEHQLPWAAGDEGIFFLVPAFGFDAVPDLYVASLGSVGVITDDLDYWSTHIPLASDALAALTVLSAPEPMDDVVVARQTDLIAEGIVATVGPPRELLGWGPRRSI